MSRKPSPERFGENTIINKVDFSCQHNKFELDEQLDRVFCGLCGEGLSPVWVLKQFMRDENRSIMNINRLRKIEEKTRNKLRCKCEHCEKITGIDRKAHITNRNQVLVNKSHYDTILEKSKKYDQTK